MSASASRPSKRSRKDAPAPSISRSSEFWLEDGTVVIQASDIQYRVHRGTLSMHSEFFKSMFELPQPQNQATIEGCPVVEVSDASSDWVALLTMLYRPFEMINKESVSHLFYVSIMRLGKKYEFTTLAEAGLNELKKKFKDPRTCITQRDFQTIFSVIEACEELRIDVLRPALYYWCIREMTPIQIANGISCMENDTEIRLHLPTSFRDNLIVYRDDVRQTLITHVWYPHYMTRASTPRSKSACQHALQRRVALILTTTASLPVMEQLSVDGLCVSCKSHVSGSLKRSLDAFFHQLPLCFKMKSYDQLKDYAE